MTFKKKEVLPNTPYNQIMLLKAKMERLATLKSSIEKEWHQTARETAELLKHLENAA